MADKENITYISILTDILRKKELVLRELLDATNRQGALLEREEFDIDDFNRIVDEKEVSLNRLAELDEGFMELYEKVRTELVENTSAYAQQVREVQMLVRTQTELSTLLQSAEEKNRTKLSIHLSQSRQKVKDYHVSSATAAAYYKNMSGKHQDGDSYFFNRKK